MSKLDIIRAWKDEEYCESLSADDRLRLPKNPAGIIELTDQDLSSAQGGTITSTNFCETYYPLCSQVTYCPMNPITMTITFGIEQLQG